MAQGLPSVVIKSTRLSRPILVPSEFDLDLKSNSKIMKLDEVSGSGISALESVHPHSAASTKVSSRDSLMSFESQS